jgi:hypothetical protein
VTGCKSIVGLAILLLHLSGCYTIGRDFVRPPMEQFELRRTTPGQVLAAAGQPAGISHTERNGKRIERFQYTYFTAAGFAAGVGPVGRMASFYFTDGLLIGYLYTSSFPGESTDFAVDNAVRIEKGKSTRADVEAALGRPHGVILYPLADGDGNSQLRYNYTGGAGPMGAGGIVSKDVLVTLNERGIVTDLTVSSERR